MIILSFINIKFLHTHYITIQNSINSVPIHKVNFPQAVWLICSLASVMSLGFGFVFLCSLSNYFPVFYWTLLHIKIKNTFTYLIFVTSASVLHISVKLSSPYPGFCWKYHQSCPHYSALTSHELVIKNFSKYFKTKWYSSCLLPL